MPLCFELTQQKFDCLAENWIAASGARGGLVLAADGHLELRLAVQEEALVPGLSLEAVSLAWLDVQDTSLHAALD